MKEYERGSEWRRWDLHIHTPNTKKNDQYSGSTIEEKWDKFYEDVNSYVKKDDSITSKIACIGITDYLSIDNYLKVIQDNKLPDCVKLVLPNVEMRIQPIANDSPINIHFIFEPDFVKYIETRFFSKLSFTYGSTSFSAAKSELIRLGNTLDSSLTEEEAYKKGISAFVPSIAEVKKLFEDDSELRNHVIIGVSNGTSDGVSGAANHSDYIENKDSQLIAFRQDVYKFADVIFSSKPNDINYFLGKKQSCPIDKVINSCGKLMPCIHGSDAHQNDKIFEPHQKRYCWIKADVTFNGLKQIIYEPYERVRISDAIPETKADYYVIDRVEFSDDKFQSEPIFFNDKLTCIIGGKSTGKSILLQNMARSIDIAEAEKYLKQANNKTLDINNIKVFWKDGHDKTRKIVYIPQTYLNKLSDEKQEKTEVDNWIQEIILREEKAAEAYAELTLSIKEYKVELEKNIVELFDAYNSYTEFVESLKEIGDKVGIEKEIKKLQEEKDKLSKELNLSEEDIKSYDGANHEKSMALRRLDNLNNNKKSLEKIESLVEPKKINYALSDDLLQKISDIQKIHIAETEKLWRIEKEKITADINAKIAKEEELVKKHDEIINSLKEKIESSNAILELSKKIQKETENLQVLEEKTKEKNSMKKKIDTLITTAVQSMDFYKQVHQKFSDVVNEHKIMEDGLEFYVDIPFRKDMFLDRISAIFNNRVNPFKTEFDADAFREEDYNCEKITKLVTETLSEGYQLKKEFTKESALREILGNWYNVIYRVKMDDDTIDSMSPGKKALVFLKILISLADSKCPILIDQPEDDLDNRSIYDDLIEFIKIKKKERQIIIVTHNANIVLGSDAEEVIVANQHGKTSKNKKYKFEYRSGSIENNLPVFDENGNIDKGVLNSQGIQQHICDILEGGPVAFEVRKNKYHIR